MINIDCDSNIYINWKPDTIVGINNYFRKVFSGKGITLHSFMDREWSEVISDMLKS